MPARTTAKRATRASTQRARTTPRTTPRTPAASVGDAVRGHLDYDLAPTVEASTPGQLRAMADPTRTAILDLVLDRAATVTELAEALGKPKATVDHHVKVLQRAGLLKVVRTHRVRAITERYWGRTARTIRIANVATRARASDPAERADPADPAQLTHFLAVTLADLRDAVDAGVGPGPGTAPGPLLSTYRRARVPHERAAEFAERLHQLALEFSTTPRGGDVVYGLSVTIFPTAQPALRDPS